MGITHYYNDAGQRTSTTGPLFGVTTNYQLDGLGRTTRVCDNATYWTLYEYDSLGRHVESQ